MKNQYRLSAAVVMVIILIVGCRSSEIIESGEKPVLIAPRTDSCSVVNTHRQYNFLFGTIPINKIRFGNLGSETGYRVIKRNTWKDVAISILGGMYLTISSNTLELQRCTESYIVTSKKEFSRQTEKMLYAALSAYAAKKSLTEEKDLPLLLTTDGNSLQGPVLEIKPNAIVMGEKKEIPITGEMQESDWIFLKNGSIIFAQDARFSDDMILYKLNGEKKEIKTTELNKVRYKHSRSESENSGRLTVIVPKEVPNENVLRLLLEPGTELKALETELKNSGIDAEKKPEDKTPAQKPETKPLSGAELRGE